MKTWNETREVLEAAKTCLNNNQSCAIVVLTHVKRSAFRRPGAKLLIRSDGTMTGNVSGGCLENDLRERAMKCIASNTQSTVHYDTGSDEDIIWGLGLGCDGELDLLLVPITNDADWVQSILDQMSSFEPFALKWNCVEGPVHDPKVGRVGPTRRGGFGETALPDDTFVDELQPPPEFVIIGTGDDAIPLAQQADHAGFRITVVDHRPGYLTEERFPEIKMLQLRPESVEGKLPTHDRTMVVIKNHALEMDKKWAAFYDTTDARYIGILGPKKRCDQVREQMTLGNMDRVYGPAGIDVGAEGAEQIALSIITEALSVWSERPPINLRDRESSIHAR